MAKLKMAVALVPLRNLNNSRHYVYGQTKAWEMF